MENRYKVVWTKRAVKQLLGITHYIFFDLQNPAAAEKLAMLIDEEASLLAIFPAKYPSVENEPWRRRGIHKMTIKNFIRYYQIDSTKKTVSIRDVVYGQRRQPYDKAD